MPLDVPTSVQSECTRPIGRDCYRFGQEMTWAGDKGAIDEDVNTILVKGPAGELVWNGVRWTIPGTLGLRPDYRSI